LLCRGFTIEKAGFLEAHPDYSHATCEVLLRQTCYEVTVHTLYIYKLNTIIIILLYYYIIITIIYNIARWHVFATVEYHGIHKLLAFARREAYLSHLEENGAAAKINYRRHSVAAPLHMVAGGALILLFCDVFWL
jgi:hypothetical protein